MPRCFLTDCHTDSFKRGFHFRSIRAIYPIRSSSVRVDLQTSVSHHGRDTYYLETWNSSAERTNRLCMTSSFGVCTIRLAPDSLPGQSGLEIALCVQ